MAPSRNCKEPRRYEPEPFQPNKVRKASSKKTKKNSNGTNGNGTNNKGTNSKGTNSKGMNGNGTNSNGTKTEKKENCTSCGSPECPGSLECPEYQRNVLKLMVQCGLPNFAPFPILQEVKKDEENWNGPSQQAPPKTAGKRKQTSPSSTVTSTSTCTSRTVSDGQGEH